MKRACRRTFLILFLLQGELLLAKSTDIAFNTRRTIKVNFNENVELLGFAYTLGVLGADIQGSSKTFNMGDQEIKVQDWYAYHLRIYNQYQAFKNSSHLQTSLKILTDNNLWLDYVINLLIQVDKFPNAKLDGVNERYYKRFCKDGTADQAKINATLFLQSLNQLYKEVRFDTFLKDNKKYYSNALKQVKSMLPSNNFVNVMEAFYQQKFDSYILLPSLTIPTSMGFGIKYDTSSGTHIYNVFGPLTIQRFNDKSKLDMGFGDKNRLLEISTHEFGHSFVNPIIYGLAADVIKPTEGLYSEIKEDMRQQGYNSWATCLTEHFVRAGEVIIAKRMGNIIEAERLKEHYTNTRRFIFLPQIIKILDQVEKPYHQTVHECFEHLKSLSESR